MKKVLMEEDENYIKTGITGFDDLFENGIPKGSSILVAGGAGTGKTNFCLQILARKASQGKNCYFMGFKESEEKLVSYMKNFGVDLQKYIDSGNLKIKRFLTSEIYYYDKKSGSDIQAMMTKDVDPLLMELEPLTIVDDVGFKPDYIVLDSLTSLSSTFRGKEQFYRFYVERLFRYFDKTGSTNFLITETKQVPEIFSPSGVEEFLADGVVVFYNFKRGKGRKKAIEILKMRGEEHKDKFYEMSITNKGIEVYPDKEVSID